MSQHIVCFPSLILFLTRFLPLFYIVCFPIPTIRIYRYSSSPFKFLPCTSLLLKGGSLYQIQVKDKIYFSYKNTTAIFILDSKLKIVIILNLKKKKKKFLTNEIKKKKKDFLILTFPHLKMKLSKNMKKKWKHFYYNPFIIILFWL